MRIETNFNRRAALGMLAVGVSPTFAQFRVEVTGVGMTQVPLAIVPFRGEGQSPQNQQHRQGGPGAQWSVSGP